MKKFDLQKLKDLPIEQVATKLGMNIQKHKPLCPFHADKHASLSFYTKRNTFKCFACGEHGGVIDLAMQILGKNFKETCHWLAEEHNIITCHPERSEGSENTNSEKIINQPTPSSFRNASSTRPESAGAASPPGPTATAPPGSKSRITIRTASS